MAELRETAMGYVSLDDHGTISSNEKKWVTKIIRLHASHPKLVEILHWPDDNNGTIVAHVPKNWIKVSPPRQVNYTDEQKAAMAERLRTARENKE